MEKREISKKVCLLGDSQVGKTSTIRRFVHDQFDDMYIMTFGAKVSSKLIKFYTDEEEYSVSLAIWDIVGEHSRRYLQASHYKGAAGAIAVCDCTRLETFEHIDDWIDAFNQSVSNGKLVFLLNKIDLKDRAVVTIENLQTIAEKHGADCFETSAKTGENVEMAFKALTMDMVIPR